MLKTRLCRDLAIDHPILSAPLGGGNAGPELAAAVSNAGGLGFLGMGGLPRGRHSRAHSRYPQTYVEALRGGPASSAPAGRRGGSLRRGARAGATSLLGRRCSTRREGEASRYSRVRPSGLSRRGESSCGSRRRRDRRAGIRGRRTRARDHLARDAGSRGDSGGGTAARRRRRRHCDRARSGRGTRPRRGGRLDGNALRRQRRGARLP